MTPFTRAYYIDAITNALSYLKSQVELNNVINKYSIDIEAEDFYAGFLSVVYGFRLTNANHAEKNVASIDLHEECCRDDGQRVAVQVTSRNDAEKIKKTLESFSEYKYQKAYTRLIILMITTKKKYRSKFSFTGESRIEFDQKKDILDVKDLQNHISSITDTDHIERIYEYLKKELPPSILYINNIDDTNSFRSNDNELFNSLMNIFSNDRKTHPSIRMMDDLDPNLFPKGLPKIKSDNRLAVVNEESPRAIKEMILDSWKRDDKRHILLVGEGGIGKTVAMLTLPEEEWFRQYRIPVIYVPLQRLDAHEGRLNSFLREKFGADYDRIIELGNRAPEGHPRLLLLLDGFNEIPDKFKQTAERFIREWMGRAGLQIITTSRLGFSLENWFSKYQLQTLPPKTVESFLVSAGIKKEHLPKKNDHIWKVINVPQMLTLYTRIDKVKEIADCTSVAQLLDWRKADNAAHIIWNYLQTELYRCIEKAGTSYSPMQYVTAILLAAPYVCCQMSRKLKFYIDQEELQGLIREALSFYGGRQNYVSRQFLNLQEEYDPYQEEYGPYSEKSLFQEKMASEYSRIMVNNIALFQKQKTSDEKGRIKNIYSLMHQNFRDALAAFFISSCLPKASDSSEKSLFLDYADHYVKNYIAEYLSEEEVIGVWNCHRKNEPENGRITWILLDIIGRQRNYDFRELDFSNIDLTKTNIHRLVSKRLDICPLPKDGSLFDKAKICLKSFSPEGHSDSINSVSYSPDGRHFASGSNDNSIKIWDLESGESYVLKGNISNINCVAYSPKGKYLASGSDDFMLRIWDLDSGKCCMSKNVADRIKCVAYSPDGMHLAIGTDYDSAVIVLDLENGKSRELHGHKGGINSVTYSPDGRSIASGSKDSTVRIWNLKNGKSRVLKGHEGWVNSVVYSLDGMHIMTGAADRTVRIWNLENGEIRVLKGHTDWINNVAYSPDGRHLASVSYDRTVRIWNIESGDCCELEGHAGRVLCVVYSPDGRNIISGADDGSIRIWDMESGENRMLESHAGWVRSVVFSPDGRHLAAGADDRTVRIWSLNGREDRVLGGHAGRVLCVAYSPDGKHLASGADDRTIRIWNLENRKSLVLEGHLGWVKSVAYSPDGMQLASSSEDKTVRIWDLKSRNSLVLDKLSTGINCIVYNSDGMNLVGGTTDNKVLSWKLKDGWSSLLQTQNSCINSVAYSSDGRYLASGASNGTIKISYINSQKSRNLEDGTGWINSVACSPDGRHLASDASDGMVRIWNLESGENHVLEGHTDWVRSVAYSPDGRYLVSSADDRTVRFWDLKRNQEVKRYVIIPHLNLSGANFELAIVNEEDKNTLKWTGARVKINGEKSQELC